MATLKKNWKWEGGGCMVGFGPKVFCCDDTFVNSKTKQVVVVRSTYDAHYDMPRAVRSISDLTRRVGVSKRVRKLSWEEYTH